MQSTVTETAAADAALAWAWSDVHYLPNSVLAAEMAWMQNRVDEVSEELQARKQRGLEAPWKAPGPGPIPVAPGPAAAAAAAWTTTDMSEAHWPDTGTAHEPPPATGYAWPPSSAWPMPLPTGPPPALRIVVIT